MIRCQPFAYKSRLPAGGGTGKSSEKFDKFPKIAYHFKAKYNTALTKDTTAEAECKFNIHPVGIKTELRQKRGDVHETHISTTSSEKEK